ncbi:ADP-ribosylation factor-binding protein GGA3 [Takifugu flavidus]|uniref:ADP-ribosylation factor-binding protein GGA3 n=1 Tax=Takifugu flavidus TaxID=433684 RepID=A0A5C6N203_9TELE|nr:ADP-ribosylation factor-binding protein GGA3 [Takifugu flavidus]
MHLGDILQASDHLSHAINSYEKIVDRKMERTPQKRARKGPSCTQSSDILIDLLDVDVQSVSQTQQQTPASSTSPPTDLWGLSATEPHLSGHSAPSAAPSLLDDEPLSLSNDSWIFLLHVTQHMSTKAIIFQLHSITTTPLPLIRDTQAASTAPSAKTHEDFCTLLHPTATSNLPLIQPTSFSGQETSLSDVFVPLSDIKPSQMRPVMACDRNGIRFLLHFATDCPAGRPDVLVIVASILSTAPLPVRDVVLQAAVPKMMKVRLQQPSGRELAPFNPIHPPAAITQVMLLANPLKVKVRLRYKLTFTLGAQSCTEVGEVNEFPTADTLGALPDNSESPKTGFEGGCQGQRLVLMNDNTWNCNH